MQEFKCKNTWKSNGITNGCNFFFKKKKKLDAELWPAIDQHITKEFEGLENNTISFKHLKSEFESLKFQAFRTSTWISYCDKV